MKKYIKLISIFLAIAAAIVGASYAIDFFRDDIADATSIQRNNYARLSSQTESGWYDRYGWDRGLYDTQMREIDNAYRLNDITTRQKESLKELVNTSALFRLKTIMEAEMKRADSRESVVEAAVGGLNVIKSYTNNNGERPFENDRRLTTLLNMSRAYKSVMTFTKTSFSKTASVNSDTYKWESYLPMEAELKSKKEAHLRSSYYNSYFSQITRVRNKMNGFDEELAKAKREYYSSVLSQLNKIFSKDAGNLFRQIDRENSKYVLDAMVLTKENLAIQHKELVDDLIKLSNDLIRKSSAAKKQLEMEYPNTTFSCDLSYTQQQSLKNLKEISQKLEQK